MTQIARILHGLPESRRSTSNLLGEAESERSSWMLTSWRLSEELRTRREGPVRGLRGWGAQELEAAGRGYFPGREPYSFFLSLISKFLYGQDPDPVV